MIVMLHGFGREGRLLEQWRDLLPVPVGILNLPCHGGEPQIPDPTLPNLVDHVAARIPEGALVIGESLGGVIALGLAARGWPAMAFDPVLSTAKLWPLQLFFKQKRARGEDFSAFQPMLSAVFGIAADGALEERNYWPLLDEIEGAVDIVAGTVPLWNEGTPLALSRCVLDEIDIYHLSRRTNVRLHRVEGPHTMLTESVEACRRLILERLAR